MHSAAPDSSLWDHCVYAMEGGSGFIFASGLIDSTDTFCFHSSRMTRLLKVGRAISETVSCRKSRYGFNKEVMIVNESLEMGEQNVTHISFD